MTTEIGAYDAKTRLPELLRQVSPVRELQPAAQEASASAAVPWVRAGC